MRLNSGAVSRSAFDIPRSTIRSGLRRAADFCVLVVVVVVVERLGLEPVVLGSDAAFCVPPARALSAPDEGDPVTPLMPELPDPAGEDGSFAAMFDFPAPAAFVSRDACV